MSEKLTIILGGITLPDQTDLVEATTPNETDATTLDGSLYTDFVNYRRSWSVNFPPLCRDDYEAIYDLYKSQYTSESFVTLVCDALSISTIVKLNIGDMSFRWNGDQIEDFPLTLKEQLAIS